MGMEQMAVAAEWFPLRSLPYLLKAEERFLMRTVCLSVKEQGRQHMTIKKVAEGYRLESRKTGKNLGTYKTKAEAEERERQVQYFKKKAKSK